VALPANLGLDCEPTDLLILDLGRFEREELEVTDWHGNHLRSRLSACGLVLHLAVAITTAVAASAQAQALDPADLADGMRLFQQKGNCSACHGWAGDGRKMDNQMPDGADLRARPIDRETLIATIKCGRPGTGMPAFDRLAYSDGRCFGLKLADLRARNLTLTDPPATLQPNEVALLADFLLVKIIGKGPIDRAGCVAFWGKDVEVCSELAK
jgi:mono/diheme cytochrome c family protein